MRLDTLLKAIQPVRVDGSTEMEVEAIAYDSRRVKPGTAFVALKGEKVDGAAFIPKAVDAGAVAIVTESEALTGKATQVLVSDARESLADLAAEFYHHPSADLKVSAVTGTNGKTTTTFLIKQICDHALWRCGLIGTVQYQIGDRVLPASRTTPESLEVHQLLAEMRDSGSKAATMEVSSHALCQARVRGVEFDVAVFTNLTQDHLDYHKTMEAYFQAKSVLFTGLAGQRKKAKAVINTDDRFGQRLVQTLTQHGEVPVITYGQGARADFRASNIRIDFNGTSYQLDANGKSYLVRLPLIGASMFTIHWRRSPRRGFSMSASAESPCPSRCASCPRTAPDGAGQSLVQGLRRLCSYRRRAVERDQDLPRVEAKPAHRGFRLRWKSRSGQASEDGCRRRCPCRFRCRDERQSAQGGSAGDH
jgi:UDP-N-acetylmuramoyl-L-alanyl-D-glutamate--2,6-diaminopimelate ligase